MRSLANPGDVADLRRRIQLVRADSPRRWGQMTAAQMVCHLNDAFLMISTGRPISSVAHLGNRTVVKWIALYAPVRWPQGVPTRPELDQVAGAGTPPAVFDQDIATLLTILDQAASDERFFHARTHPIFGPLSHGAWLRWGWLHVDHHLRQFGA
jgi:hypothetical protein